MKYYLVKKTQIFVDPHGSPDEGGHEFYVTTDKTDPEVGSYNYTYFQCEEKVEDEDLQASEDGYNSTAEMFSSREITKVQYNQYQKIIENYGNLNF